MKSSLRRPCAVLAEEPGGQLQGSDSGAVRLLIFQRNSHRRKIKNLKRRRPSWPRRKQI